MPPRTRLDHAVAGYSSPALAKSGESASNEQRNLVTYRWTQFHGKEETTEFDLDAHFALEGNFECNSSVGHKEYQDRLRATHFREEGKTKSEIATILGRSEKFVAKWWQKATKEIPRPNGVHAYLSHDNGGAFGQGAVKTSDSAMDAATHWRDVEIRRGFAKDPAVYDELLRNADWKQAEGSTTRDFRTGARHLKYDKEGNIRLQGYLRAKYKQSQSPALDAALQKLFATYGIEDRTSGILLNYYEDGKMMLGSHRHDCWTALFSFGSDRILTIDKTPVLCRDGDLINFGTQRHGVPLMPEISDGRITIPVFFYPDKLQKQAMWQTITDDEAAQPSAKYALLQTAAKLSAGARDIDLWSSFSNEILQLCELGFSEDLAKDALISCEFDIMQATCALLDMRSTSADVIEIENAEQDSLASSSGRWRRGRVVECRSAETAADSTTQVSNLAQEIDVSSTSLQVQTDEEAMNQAYALALQMDEMENNNGLGECLQAQFQQYESELDRLDAEDRWNGTNGDLMAFRQAQENLTLDSMEHAKLFSIGHADMNERDFFEVLQLNSVRVLYDTRPTDYRDELVSIPDRFTVKHLKMACKSRGIFYKQMVVGRESAYGTLAHLRSDQGKHILIELAWQAKRKSTAFLGRASDWRHDHRLAIAQDLCNAGHNVEHISPDGSREVHSSLKVLPDWLTSEEERFRKLEKQRKSGEVKKPQKSAVDRSLEFVASSLMRPAEQIDAGALLRDAESQIELKVAQQKLSRIHRIAESKELPRKVLANAPTFIKQESIDRVAKSAKDEKALSDKGDGTCPKEESPEIECVYCRFGQSWITLQENNGKCKNCSQVLLDADAFASCSASAQDTSDRTEQSPGDDLLVECTKCGQPYSWSILVQGDGCCHECLALSAATQQTMSASVDATVGKTWRSRRRQDSSSQA